MIKYREYCPGDEKDILCLYLEVFEKDLTIETWEWKYNGLYPDKKLIFLAFENLNCIGHYALMPYRINAYGKGIKSFISLDSMVHPNYRGQRIFSQLVEYAHSQISNLDEPYITFFK